MKTYKTLNGVHTAEEEIQNEMEFLETLSGAIRNRRSDLICWLSKSQSNFGNSCYLQITDKDFNPLLKIRCSDHSIGNARMKDEYNIIDGQSIDDIINDLFR